MKKYMNWIGMFAFLSALAVSGCLVYTVAKTPIVKSTGIVSKTIDPANVNQGK